MWGQCGAVDYAGGFAVSCVGGRTVNLSLPSAITIVNAAENKMTVNNFVSDKGTKFVLEGSGDRVTNNINIGAVLNVPANAAVGKYTGTYTVMVSY